MYVLVVWVCFVCILIVGLQQHAFFFQGRHIKTGQLAAIKIMEVTEVRSFFRQYRLFAFDPHRPNIY